MKRMFNILLDSIKAYNFSNTYIGSTESSYSGLVISSLEMVYDKSSNFLWILLLITIRVIYFSFKFCFKMFAYTPFVVALNQRQQ